MVRINSRTTVSNFGLPLFTRYIRSSIVLREIVDVPYVRFRKTEFRPFRRPLFFVATQVSVFLLKTNLFYRVVRLVCTTRVFPFTFSHSSRKWISIIFRFVAPTFRPRTLRFYYGHGGVPNASASIQFASVSEHGRLCTREAFQFSCLSISADIIFPWQFYDAVLV